MRNNGIQHFKSAPYHLATNALAKVSLETRILKFLMWYRLTSHSTTGVAPAELLLKRIHWSLLDIPRPYLEDKGKLK